MSSGSEQPSRSHFTTTQWSVILDVANTNPARARIALEKLCTRYWYPLYAFARRRGGSPEDAEDLTQAFFMHLIEKDALRNVHPEKGLFRSFLLRSMTHFANDEYDKSKAIKRGKGKIIAWDSLAAEEMYRHEPVDMLTPEDLFERRWALTLIQQAIDRIRHQYELDGKEQRFHELEHCLTAKPESGFYLAVATKLGMTEGAVRVELHRMRLSFRELVRSEIAHTVSRPEQVEEEIQYLLTKIARWL